MMSHCALERCCTSGEKTISLLSADPLYHHHHCLRGWVHAKLTLAAVRSYICNSKNATGNMIALSVLRAIGFWTSLMDILDSARFCQTWFPQASEHDGEPVWGNVFPWRASRHDGVVGVCASFSDGVPLLAEFEPAGFMVSLLKASRHDTASSLCECLSREGGRLPF